VNPLDVLLEGAATPEENEGLDSVTLLEHGLQCAALLAWQRPDDVELQVAGLLHDIGHTLVPGDVDGHGRHAAAYLEPILGSRVADLVALHVPAKRWLVTTDPAYTAQLSAGSLATLALQGATMTPAECAAFEASPWFDDAVVLRRADEGAKVGGLDVGALDRWRPVVESLRRR
jgi:predicted HD phosphohydrolase